MSSAAGRCARWTHNVWTWAPHPRLLQTYSDVHTVAGFEELPPPPDFFAMTGSEIVVDNVLGMGAHGVVPGLANVDPHGYVKLWNLFQAGDQEAARKEQERLCRLFEIVWIAQPRTSAGSAGVGAFKTAMRQLGIISTNVMARPQRMLNAEETAKVDAILRSTGLL